MNVFAISGTLAACALRDTFIDAEATLIKLVMLQPGSISSSRMMSGYGSKGRRLASAVTHCLNLDKQ